MNVPLLDLRPQYSSIRAEVRGAIEEILESQQFVLGPLVEDFERATAQYVGTKFAIGCASGSDAILLALVALGVGPGDEVVCPSFTFFATAGSIARLGAKPVFAEIDSASYNVDPDSLRDAAKRCRRLKAILPVHLYGQAADMDACLKVAKEFGVPVVEDAAQAIGARDQRGFTVGSRGTVGCFSFYPTKNLGGCGDGGMITTNDSSLAAKLAILRVHGMEPKYHHSLLGFNSRLDAIQAAVLKVKLKYLDQWSESRRENAACYDRAFAEAGARTSVVPLADDSGELPLRTPHPPGGRSRHVYHQYVIRVPGSLRDSMRSHLSRRGVGTEVYYPVPLHRQECFTYLGYGEGDLPESEAAAKETIALPIYPELTEAQLNHVAETCLVFLRDHAAAASTGG